MAITVADITLQKILNFCNLNQFMNALKKVKLGNVLAPVKVTFVGLSAAAAIDITTNASRLAATIVGLDRGLSDNLPAIHAVKTVRVTASGTANSLGTYAIGDAGSALLSPLGSTVVGVALLSDDGKTLTFPSTITAFVIQYIPRPEFDVVTTIWPSNG